MTQWILDRLVALEKRVAELEAAARPDAKPVRSARLPADWKPRPADIAWATEKYGDTVDEEAERDRFVDYWVSKGEARRDWDAAYRNWIRKAHDISASRKPVLQGRPASRTAGLAETNRAKRNSLAAELATVRRDPARE